MSYFVKSWTLPKRRVGTYPRGYVSTLVNEYHDALARAKEWARGPLGRRVEIEDSFTGETRTYLIRPDGAIVENPVVSMAFHSVK